jgi:hypothetical protein
LHEKRRIRVSQFVSDIRTPISDFELMQKHDLTPKQLHSLFRKLIRRGTVAEGEIYKRPLELQNSAHAVPTRRSERCRLGYTLPIYDEEYPNITGWVEELSDNGLRARGIAARIGDLKTLVIPAYEFSESGPVVLHAVCRWFDNGKDLKDCAAGFEIFDVSDTALKWIRETIQVFTFGG